MFWMTLRGAKRAHEAAGRPQPSSECVAPVNPPSAVSIKRRRGLDTESSMDWAPAEENRQAQQQNCQSTSQLMRHFLVDTPVQLHRSFSARTKFDSHDCRLVAINFTPHGDIVASDAGNKKVKIFGACGKLKVECSIPRSYAFGLVEPSGVAVLESGEIITCDRRSGNLKVFTADGKCLTTIGRTLVRPCGLAITSTSAIVIADEAKRDVIIFKSISDRKPLSLQRLNSQQLTLQSPCSVCVTSTDQIVVLDIALKKFLLFSKEGALCSDNLIPKDVMGQLQGKSELNQSASLYQGLSVCKGPDGSILIGHSALGSIIQYDVTQRKVCRRIVDNNNVTTKPCAIATDAGGFLGVIEDDRQMLRIFKYMR